ncbi:Alpha/Beta hydrolase protein [Truncatella angustata]|uniref:Alpha/Beta hydrolase protein n=1 Tax=Truncatella angustata TaxID=152316 RepID=A0A9P8UMQ7_9PEZI|nr:Alpha/Beta hydrolase protein [Truncatella angustata]KAH6654924.1 Alpha/Beta hydrolase protein [Truncatella angustata]KAH8194206.1 hypothetical protein TruAng_011628 [Truncatella angustata]
MVHSTCSLLSLAASAAMAHAAAPLYQSPVNIPGWGSVQGTAALNSSVAEYVVNWANISFFGGIPFGASTEGANRFAPPQPASPWNTTLDATSFGPICPTSNMQLKQYSMSEDCLSVNIWTPATSADEKLPVAFWSYGDGTAPPQTGFNGAGVASKGIIFVSYNYRNGVLGFLADSRLPETSDSNATGNWGVLDQFAAVKWVHENIAAFGGDPDHITVLGQSFGSAATYHIVNSNLTTGLGIVGAISESGVRSPNDVMTSEIALSYDTMEAAEAIGADALAAINATTIEEARAVTYETILANTGSQDQQIKPVLDYYAIPDKYIVTIRDGAANKVPYITGNNADEYGVTDTFTTTVADFTSYVQGNTGNTSAAFLAAYPANNDTQASQSQIAFVRDQSTVSSWQAMSGFGESSGELTYTYFWNYAPPNDGSASHGSEIPYALGNLWAQPGVNYTSEDYYIANVLSSYWANFIKTSDPNTGSSYNNGSLPATWNANSQTEKTTFKVGAEYKNIGVAASEARIQAFLEWFAITPAI